MDIQNLIAQHPNDVALLFKAYGYQMPVTLENATMFFRVNGHKDLPFNSYTGEKPKGKLWDILNKGVDLATKVVPLINPKKYAKLSPNYNPANELSVNDERIFGIDKKVFLTLAGITVLILAVLLFKSKK